VIWTPRRCRFPKLLRRGKPIRESDYCSEQAVTRLEIDMPNGVRVALDVCKRHDEQIRSDGGIETAYLEELQN
jgi:hypothetical protein